MKTRTSEDVLAGAARLVGDADSLKWWVEELLSTILPSAAVLCGQSIPHSGGYAAIQTWSFGLPPAYEAAIVCVGGNVRSPILTPRRRGRAARAWTRRRAIWTRRPKASSIAPCSSSTSHAS